MSIYIPYSDYKLAIPAPDEDSFNQHPTIKVEAYETVGDGGRQSVEPERYDLIPPVSLRALALIHAEGAAKHGEGNWKHIPIHRHIGRALGHLVKYTQGDRSEPHLSHALCRINMAFALAEESE